MNKRELFTGILAAAVIGIPSIAKAESQPLKRCSPRLEPVLICNIPLKYGKTMTMQFEQPHSVAQGRLTVRAVINPQMLEDLQHVYGMDTHDVAKSIMKTWPMYKTISSSNKIWLWEMHN